MKEDFYFGMNMLDPLEMEEEKHIPIDTKENLFKELLKKANTKESNIKNIYPYATLEGKILFEIVEHNKNYKGQIFSVRHKEGEKYEYGLNNIEPIPYYLPKLKDLQGKIVFLVDGEDKVDLLSALDFSAATAPFKSAWKWKRGFNQYLSHAKAVLVIQEKESQEKYIQNTIKTLGLDINNICSVNLSDVANKLGIDIKEITIPNLYTAINNREEFRNIFKMLEESVSESIDEN